MLSRTSALPVGATILGCATAILFGLAHLAGHFVFFGSDQPSALLAAGREAMLAARIETGGMRTTRWDLFLFLSLALSIGSVAFGMLGLATLRAAKRDLAVARSIAAVGIAFALALLAAGAAHRVLQPIAAGTGMILCFVAGFRPPAASRRG